ncbi:hypothetical protein CP533_5892 [Ophiocordyceps camponoti-saundersi (nom. inval.)]|nr:hypothetical protein CP533_5892 [Ophiocordyceps camponoti-saundersi (nom. inval.)]
MRFGKTLREAVYEPWKDEYMDYGKLKGLLHEDKDEEWTEEDEKRFCDEIFSTQLDKVARFQRKRFDELQRRVDRAFGTLTELVPAQGAQDDDKRPADEVQSRLRELEAELDDITDQVKELKKYSSINYTGFLKMVKKHDRKRGDRYRVRPVMQLSLAQRPFNSEQGYSPLLNKLSVMYFAIRQQLEGERGQAPPDLESPGETLHGELWIHADNLIEVKTLILRRLPALVYSEQSAKELDGRDSPAITSLYLDNHDFDIYSAKLDRKSEASTLRLRWYGQLSDRPEIFVEHKTADDKGHSQEHKFPTKDKYIKPLLNGDNVTEKRAQKLERQGVSTEQVQEYKTTVAQTQELIRQKKLSPVLRANYVRTAFQKPADDRVRISIDANLVFIREDTFDASRPCRDPNEWHRLDIDNSNMTYPFKNMNQSEISKFPYAVLQIKLKEDGNRKRPSWVEDLMASHLIHPAPRFSKFVHGVASLFEDYVNNLPFWLSDLETDIRKDPQRAFEEEEQRRAQRADDVQAVGSLLAATRTGGSSTYKAAQSSPVGDSFLAERAVADSKASMSRSLGKISTVEERGESHEQGASGSYGTLASVFPGLSLSKYSRAKRQLPEGVVKPTQWIKNMGELKVEPKVWLANERTFLKWQHICVLQGSLALGLYTAAGKDTAAGAMGIVFVAIAAFAGLWGYYMLRTRRRMIMERSGKDFDRMLGPIVMSGALMTALIINFVLQDHYIGVDVGTGSARACIIDESGDIKALASRDIKLWQPETGYYEQSTTDIWQCVCECVRKVVSESGVEAASIKGIGFDATCSLAVFSRDTDEPVPVTGPDFANDGQDRNVILWLDHRPVEETRAVNATNHPLLKYVGGKMSIEMEIPKVLWLKNHMPAHLFSRCKFYDLADALTHLATGSEARSYCSAVCKQGYVPVGVDGSVRGWQKDFYEAVGLGDLAEHDFERMGGVHDLNGTFHSAGDRVGSLSRLAAQQLGLPVGVAVGSGVIDAYAGWVGTVGAKVHLGDHELTAGVPLNDVSQAFTRLAAVAGTSTCHLAMSESPVFVQGVWGPYRDVLLPGYWMAEGGQSATGELLRHIVDIHPAFHETCALAKAEDKHIYDFLNSHLEQMAAERGAPSIPHLARHLFFYGDLWGNRSPVADADMKGAMVGMDSDKSTDNMALWYYATMEFIAMQTRQIIDQMNGSGHAISSIFMSGSQCQNAVLMSLMATICGMPVLIPRYVHAAVVHGAAMLGARAAKGESLWSIMDRMSKTGRLVQPGTDRAEKALLDAKYDVFLDMCSAQQTYRAKIDKATAASAGGSSLFGNNQQQATSGGLFGQSAAQNQPTTTTTTTTTAAAGGGGGLFGQTGQNQQAPATGGGLFGQQPAQTQTTGATGGGGGLFGQTQNQTATTGGGGLFGQPAQNLAMTTGGGGLFGQPAQNQTTPTGGGGLFGQTAQNQTSTTLGGGGLFGQPAQNQATATGGGGLFGQPAQNQATNTGSGGLFGQTAQNQTSTAAGGGLFGQPSQNQPSLFGGSNLQGSALGASTAKPSLSLFGSTTAANANTAQPQQNALYGSLAGAPTPAQSQSQPQLAGAYFDSLFAKTLKEGGGKTNMESLPSLELGLGDLRHRLRKLQHKGNEKPLDGKAHYLLAASGVDPSAAAKDLGMLDVQGGRAERAAGYTPSELDVETYLSNLQTKTTLSMISDGLERSLRDFDNFLEDHVAMEWDAQRKRIYQHFGIKPREDSAAARDSQAASFGRSRRSKGQPSASRAGGRSSMLGASMAQRSVIGPPSRIGPHPSADFSDIDMLPADAALKTRGATELRVLRETQAKLADKVRALNEARLGKRPYAIFAELCEVAHKSPEPHAPHVVEAYRAMMELVGESDVDSAAAPERRFADLYLDENPQSVGAVEMRRRILQAANSFLEQQFMRQVESLIAKHPHEARLGGMPDVTSKIKAYIRLRSARKDLVPDNTELQQLHGEYVWAVVFYLLRSGHVNEAAQYVNDNSGQFRGIDRTFATYLNSYAVSEDRRITNRKLLDRCTNEYTQRARNAPDHSVDPFRMACYKVIGRVELANRSLDGLNTDINDWIWLQFNLAREGDRAVEMAGESYGLAELQASVRDIGLKHFPKASASDDAGNGSFGMFFYLQILAGMFEDAVAYLYPFSYVDAVHFALALTYYGLLRPSDPASGSDELRSLSVKELPQINFGRMLGYYTRDFRAADVVSAADYLALICLNDDLGGEAGRRQGALCHEALRDLVLETREFSKLLGDVRPDGRGIRGVIEERAPLMGLDADGHFVNTVTLQAASFADENGRTTDAVLLYHLAGEYDTVVAIVSRALSEAVSLEMGEDPMRLATIRPRAGVEADTDAGQQGGLSLAAIDDPVELAKVMMTLYERDAMFYSKIQAENRVACHVLLEMSGIKKLVEAGRWAQALDKMRGLEILPLDAAGDASTIRAYASKFSGLSQPVSINVPNLLMWTIICCLRQKEQLTNGQFSGNEGTRRLMVNQLKQMTLDLTTYTSQLRYRFPPHLHEALARASVE